MMTRSRRLPGLAPHKGAALVIVLAFVVLLTGLVLAYFSRTATDRKLAQVSFNDTDADLLARSALDIVIGDFKQEIISGSTNIGSSGAPFYSPIPAANVLPQRSGNPAFALPEYPNDPIPNLIRRSVRSDAILPPGVPSRASFVNSETDVSVNGRAVGRAAWNSHYLIPRDPSAPGDDSTPVNTFVAPDWVIVTRAGPASFSAWDSTLRDPTLTNNNYAVGRYAYAVYDEGGLLDINVAGFPTPSSNPPGWTTDVGRKGVLTFADLTALPTTPGNPVSTAAINVIAGFRNYATIYGTIGPQPTPIAGLNFSFNATQAARLTSYYLGPSGADPGNPIPPWTLASDHLGTSRDFGAVNVAKAASGTATRTDQNFITRAELIKLRSSTNIASVNTLQYLGTFSREKNASTWRAGGITSNQIEGQLAAPPTGPGRFYIGTLNLVIPLASVQEGIGLKWKSKGQPPDAGYGYWRYNGPTNPNALAHIPSFAGGAKHHFFKLLEYGMFGNDDGNDSLTQFITTLSVGASLIDQYDPNNNFALYTNTGDALGSTTTAIQTSSGQLWSFGMEKNDPNILNVTPAPPPVPAPAAPLPSTIFLDHYLDPGPPPPVGGRPLRGVGEFSYGIKTNLAGLPTLDFSTWPQAQNPPWGDSPVLDFFSYNSADPASGGVPIRSGVVSLNTRQPYVLAALLKGQLLTETANTTVNDAQASAAAQTIVNAAAAAPALSRADIVRLASGAVTAAPFNATNETKSAIARSLAEVVQARTWGLLIDVVAQTGHYSPNAQGLGGFIVEGEKRYWLHIAIDRFDGTVLGQQLEEVVQ